MERRHIVWAVIFCVVVLVTLVTGDITKEPFKGCVSTSFVQQYAFYYKINQPLPLKESFAVCNHRLTKYIGLEVDNSTPGSNVVYCGNDLLELSPKLNESQCRPCRENTRLLCGEDKSMALYLLRDSTPLAILMATNAGVKVLMDNVSTVLVSYASNETNKFVDYIYNQDVIISVIDNTLLRSYYQLLNMEFGQPYPIVATSNTQEGLAVDFIQNEAYWSHDLVKTDLKTKTTETLVVTQPAFTPNLISVDPYNRFMVYFLEYLSSIVYFYQLNTNENYSVNLDYLHIEEINAFAVGFQEKLLYAITTFKADSKTYLVSLDYELSRTHIFFNSPHLRNALELEVFQGIAVWFRQEDSYFTIYWCNIFSECRFGNIKTYSTPEVVGDITIYHPEKQTPGEKWLCANLTCQYGCKAVSLFTAKCICPPGQEVNLLDNTTCVDRPSTPLTTFPTILEDKDKSSKTLNLGPTQTPYDNKSTENGEDENSKLSSIYRTKIVNNDESELSFFELFIVISVLIVFLCLASLVLALYKMNKKVNYVLDNRFQLQDLSNE